MRNKISTGRGRPPGEHHTRVDISLLEYLVKISMKYEIDSDKFFQKLVNAWKNQESTCESLRIICRKRIQDYAIFLITSRHKVVAQFPIPEHILKETDPLIEFTYVKLRKKPLVKEDKARGLQIRDLRAGMKHINVKARVLEVPEPTMVFTRFGECVNVTNALIADETGVIRLSLWNKQIKTISVDDVIKIENAHVAAFKGLRQLRLGKNGKLSIIKDVSFPTIQEIKKAL